VPFPACISFAPRQIAQVPERADSRVAVGEEQFARRLLGALDSTAARHVVCVDGKPNGTITLVELQAEVTPGLPAPRSPRSVRRTRNTEPPGMPRRTAGVRA